MGATCEQRIGKSATGKILYGEVRCTILQDKICAESPNRLGTLKHTKLYPLGQCRMSCGECFSILTTTPGNNGQAWDTLQKCLQLPTSGAVFNRLFAKCVVQDLLLLNGIARKAPRSTSRMANHFARASESLMSCVRSANIFTARCGTEDGPNQQGAMQLGMPKTKVVKRRLCSNFAWVTGCEAPEWDMQRSTKTLQMPFIALDTRDWMLPLSKPWPKMISSYCVKDIGPPVSTYRLQTATFCLTLGVAPSKEIALRQICLLSSITRDLMSGWNACLLTHVTTTSRHI